MALKFCTHGMYSIHNSSTHVVVYIIVVQTKNVNKHKPRIYPLLVLVNCLYMRIYQGFPKKVGSIYEARSS